jgi:hypothetical protein
MFGFISVIPVVIVILDQKVAKVEINLLYVKTELRANISRMSSSKKLPYESIYLISIGISPEPKVSTKSYKTRLSMASGKWMKRYWKEYSEF